MGNIYDIIVRLVAQGAAQFGGQMDTAAKGADHIADETERAAKNTEELEKALADVGNNDALKNVGDDAEKAAEGTGKATEQANGLSDKLEKIRNVGATMTLIGGSGLAISQAFINAHKEGDGLEARLESILKTQGRLGDLEGINNVVGDVTSMGHFDDDDSIREAALHLASFSVQTQDLEKLIPRVARQVRTGFGDMASVADGMGKAYSNLDLAPLARSGLVFTDAEKAALDYAKSLGEVQGRAAFVDIVTQAVDRNTVELGDSLTETEMAANDLANAMDGAMTNMGQGAGAAQAQVNNVLASVVNLCNSAPALESAAGYLGYFGSFGLTAVGSLLTVTSQLGMTAMAAKSMGITSVASFRAMAASGVSAFMEMGASALAAAPAIWAALAPMLPVALALAAGILLVVGALYLLSGAKGALDEASEKEAQTEDKQREFFDKQQERLRSGKTSRFVKAGETFEQYKERMGTGLENEEWGATKKKPESAVDPENLLKMQEQLNSQKLASPASAPPMPTPQAMPTMPTVPAAPPAAPAAAPAKASQPAGPDIMAMMTAQIATGAGLATGTSAPTDPRAATVQEAIDKGAKILPDGSLHVPNGVLNDQTDEDNLYDELLRRQKAGKKTTSAKSALKASSQGKSKSTSAVLDVLLGNDVQQEGDGGYLINFHADPVKIPATGLGASRGRIR